MEGWEASWKWFVKGKIVRKFDAFGNDMTPLKCEIIRDPQAAIERKTVRWSTTMSDLELKAWIEFQADIRIATEQQAAKKKRP